ncbi:phosphate ABC transporter substrate-binding protein PstS [Fodinicola acaciae]|uniref:phosphate ABC transporter substrate-binding protein PstS n=1 Tax=Fodinicola acaciae TaxID=2681555 RepID=UPI0013D37374|nr:phosphate ABC transporter substrate-binding protein PstS [Fodinicola acaciae]
MKLQRHGVSACLLAVTAASAVALAGCGSDNTPTTGGSASGSAGAADCATGQISAEGSTAQGKAMDAWTQAYGKKCGASVTYNKTGSGAGVTAFSAGKVAFAGSDSALKDSNTPAADKRCGTGKAIDLPMVVSPIAVAYNLKGVSKLTLTPDAVAGIFAGKVTKWNDPAIAKSNAGVTLPATTITTVHRSKDSGTTDNFTKFLDAQSKSIWTFGTGQAWKAPGGKGAPGSADVISAVKGTDGSIAYVDGPDAKTNNLTVAALDFGQGPVELSTDTIGKAIAAAQVKQTGNDIKLTLNYGLKQAGAYPLGLVTYEITCEKGLPASQSKLVKSFLTYTASAEGQDAAAAAGHAKLPADLQTKVQAAVSAIS